RVVRCNASAMARVARLDRGGRRVRRRALLQRGESTRAGGRRAPLRLGGGDGAALAAARPSDTADSLGSDPRLELLAEVNAGGSADHAEHERRARADEHAEIPTDGAADKG